MIIFEDFMMFFYRNKRFLMVKNIYFWCFFVCV